jgi:hypothetical protein
MIELELEASSHVSSFLSKQPRSYLIMIKDANGHLWFSTSPGKIERIISNGTSSNFPWRPR